MGHRRRTRPHRPTLTKAAGLRGAAANLPASAVTFTPDQVAALVAAQRGTGGLARPLPRLDPQVPFGPGVPLPAAPINPVRPDTGRAEPRQWEYPVSWNLPGFTDRLVPWAILRAAADQISLFRKCIEIRKNEIATLDWDVVVSAKAIERAQRQDPGSSKKDIKQAMQARVEPEIGRLVDFWSEPNRRNGEDWVAWATKLLEEYFVLDAVSIFPRRTLGGDLYSFEILDGSTIKPLLDQYGYRPLPPQPAYQQILHGFPRGEFVADTVLDGDGGETVPDGYDADQLIYQRYNVRAHTPYGYSAVERALEDGDLYLRRSGWLKAEYTDGVFPAGWLLAGEGQAEWSPNQLAEYERAFNDHYTGSTPNRQRFRILPWGMQPDQRADLGEKYRPDYDLYLIKLVAGHFETTIAELGFTEPGGLGSQGWHEGQADVQDRIATKPTLVRLQSLCTRLMRAHLGAPAELEFRILGLESEDEDAQDEVAQRRVAGGRMTLNEDRDRTGLPRYDFPEADKPFIATARGVVFLEGASEQAPAGEMIGPAKPAEQPADAEALQDGDAGGAGPQAGGVGVAARARPAERPASPPKKDAKKLAKADEVAAYQRWRRRRDGTTGRPFEFASVTKADFAAAGLAVPDDVIFKADPPEGDTGGGGADPKVPDSRWPGWLVDLAVAKAWTQAIRSALTGAAGIPALVRRWLAARSGTVAHPSDKNAARGDARHWLEAQRVDLAGALRPVLVELYTEGYLVGDRASEALLRASVDVDWGGWQPGDVAAARKLLSADGRDVGLRRLLDQAQVTISSIADGRLDEVAAVLADGLARGASPQEIATALTGVLDNPDWAYMVAVTETSRASTAATLDRYHESGVAAKEWLTALDQRVCPVCDANEAEGPVGVAAPFASGDLGPPAHPLCRCALVPVVAQLAAPAGKADIKAEVAELLKTFNPDEPRGYHGRWMAAGEHAIRDATRDGEHAAEGAAPKRDPLKLARRIKLSRGEHLVESGRVRGARHDDHSVVLALVDGPRGRRLRFGVVHDEDARRWRAANLGSTAELDGHHTAELRAAVDQLRTEAPKLLADYRAAVRSHLGHHDGDARAPDLDDFTIVHTLAGDPRWGQVSYRITLGESDRMLADGFPDGEWEVDVEVTPPGAAPFARRDDVYANFDTAAGLKKLAAALADLDAPTALAKTDSAAGSAGGHMSHHQDRADHHAQPGYTASDLGVARLYSVHVDPQIVCVDRLHYQRPLDEHRVGQYLDEPRRKLAARWGLVGVRPDLSVWVVNGQHHTEAALRAGISRLRYRAFDSTGPEHEAAVYRAWEAWHARQDPHDDDGSSLK